MNMKTSLENAKRKIKENLPAILTVTSTIGSAAVAVYLIRKDNTAFYNEILRRDRIDFRLIMTEREMDKVMSGIPKKVDMGYAELYIATKDMLKS